MIASVSSWRNPVKTNAAKPDLMLLIEQMERLKEPQQLMLHLPIKTFANRVEAASLTVDDAIG